MKRFLAILLVLTMIIVTVTGCQPKVTPPSSSANSSSDVSSPEDSSITGDSSSVEDPSSDPSDEPIDSIDDSSEPDDTSSDQQEVLSKEQQRAKNITDGVDNTILNAAISSHEGFTIDSKGVKHINNKNASRVAKAISKALKGQSVTIAFIGGENTANSNPVDQSYIAQVRDWWTTTFPGEVKIIEGGYYTMTSSVAAYRIRHDVLQYKPDLVFVDFAVQDAFGGSSKTNTVYFETIVRRILEANNNTGVVALMLGGAEQSSYSMTPGNCDPISTASKYELQVADYYNLPVIDFNNAVWDTIFTLVDSRPYGEFPLLSWDTFAQINTSLNDVGHLTLAKMITNYLGIVAANVGTISKTAVPSIPTALRFSNATYMKADMLTPEQLLVKNNTTGYAITETAETLTTSDYLLKFGGPTIASQSIVCYRPSVPMNITVPEVSNDTPTYFLLTTSPKLNPDVTPPHEFSPIQLNYYDKTGALIGSNRPSGGEITEAIQSYRVTPIRIPNGTTRIEFKAYVAGGYIAFTGIAIEKPTSTITG